MSLLKIAVKVFKHPSPNDGLSAFAETGKTGDNTLHHFYPLSPLAV
jgi:hypothetical protein